MLKNYIFPMLIGIGTSLCIYKSQALKRTYINEVSKALGSIMSPQSQILTEKDIKHLPEPVQKYLRYTGVIGKEKVRNVRVVFDGEFKTDPKRGWNRIQAQQHSFFDEPMRLYLIEMKMFGVPVIGLHTYSNAKASMLIKLAGLITVAEGMGQEMNQGETVTVFNDMCLLTPASLIDERIQWEAIDDLTAKATFNNNGYEVSAVLYFNEKGELINFVSDDRYYSPTGKTYEKVRWSTPVKGYKEVNGVKIMDGGEAVWHFQEGDYCYARVDIKEIEYNQ
ncbi:MAG: DUF6544 family protein [Bacillota bacterium]